MKSKFFEEFKTFIAKGNAIDLAVGVIIGGAFTAITNSFVNDIFMPIIGLVTGGMDFSDMRIILKPATETAAEVAIRYGALINAIINFLLVAFVLFCIVKSINSIKARAEEEKKKAEEAKEAKRKAEEEAKAQQALVEAEKAKAEAKAEEVTTSTLLAEIRDLLRLQNKN